MSSQNSIVLLKRYLALKEASPFALIVDSLAQSAHFLIQEFIHKSEAPVILLSFETATKPPWASHFIDCSQATLSVIADFVSTKSSRSKKVLVIVDSLNYLHADKLTDFVSGIMLASNLVLAVYHSDCPQSQAQNYPSPSSLLSYIALATFQVEPVAIRDEEEFDKSLTRLNLPINSGLNLSVFKLNFSSKRKSGKSILYQFIVNLDTHVYEVCKQEVQLQISYDDDVLRDLTTFNLNTSDKQKLAKEQVELPFMEAQAELGKMGGAIVYQFEKDDDYDEEDPYEDPF